MPNTQEGAIHKAKMLIIEDERSMRDVLRILLEGEGYEVISAHDGLDGIGWLQKDIFDLIITDIKMPGADGFEILRKSIELSPDTLVIMITAFGTTESAVEAMKLGAYDYIYKPFKIDEIRLIVKNALDKRRLKAEVSLLRQTVRARYEPANIIGESPAMKELLHLIPRVAQSAANVLITGESGTGKDLVATALHNLSDRADKNFVAINCASLPEGLLESELFGYMKGAFTSASQNKQGLFEVANEGTLFLDEVAEMPINLQSKLLRAIDTGSFRRLGGTNDIKVNVRILSATNKDPAEAVAAGSFREDLFYRLNVIPIHIPPLRERKEDIPLYIEHFLKKSSVGKRHISPEAINLLMNQPWKGNVRQLENAIERTLLLTDKDIITEADLPPGITKTYSEDKTPMTDVSGGIDLKAVIEGMERGYITEALRLTAGKKAEAAKLLGLSFRSFRHRLQKYGIR
ncbi:MAG: sigma-54 dependent transcriptional regulator [Thermodesulfovibrionales bacterium]|nr:sigma-54 dependent transcriptional regulator [Thermodesulfovibrionales bacterium]